MAPFHPLLGVALCVAFLILGIAQGSHAFILFFMRERLLASGKARFCCRMAYELGLLVFMGMTYLGVDAMWAGYISVAGVLVPVRWLFFSSVVPLVLGACSWVAGNRDAATAVDLAFLALPPLGALSGIPGAMPAALVALCCALTFRIARCLGDDERLRRSTLTAFSVVDAINDLPSGLLCLGEGGIPIVMNRAMRELLVLLDLPGDVADFSDVWEWLEAIVAHGGRSVRLRDDCLLMATSDERWHLLECSEMFWGGRGHLAVFATDVTEEERLNRLIERSNELVASAGAEIGASLGHVQDVAREEALASMRAKVHDVLGQRLSIIHRYLEDGDFSDETMASVRSLLDNLLYDLRDVGETDARAELDAIVSNFALIDVAIEVTGSLPADERVARALVTCAREAVTNAVRHAQASRVTIRLESDARGTTMSVSNDNPIPGESSEGSGIPNMRRALREVGGTLLVEPTDPFVVRASVSNPREDS